MTAQRFTRLTLDEMNERQRAVAETILAGPRKSLDGPFSAMLHSPHMAAPLQEVGAAVRFNTHLPAPIRELVIIMVARRWSAQFEWHVHRLHAIEVGLDPAICDAVAARRTPDGMSEEEAAVHGFCRELLESGHVSDEAFAAVERCFGQQGVVDIIATAGYYTTVSFLLNADRYPAPPGATPLD